MKLIAWALGHIKPYERRVLLLAVLACLEVALNMLRRRIREKRAQLIDQLLAARATVGVVGPNRENFLELIEDEHRREHSLAPVPVLMLFAVKMFPKSVIRTRSRRVYGVAPRFSCQGGENLRSERWRGRVVIQPKIDRQMVARSEARKKTRSEKRRFAKPGNVTDA